MAKVTRWTPDEGGALEGRRLHLREIADDADLPLDNVGHDLRAARQRKGEDLATVSKALKIRKGHLEAIEESNLDALPGRAYAIGFVRSYSEYLGLDPIVLVDRFKTEIAGRTESDEEAAKPVAPDVDRKLPQGWIAFVVLFVICLIYGVYYLTRPSNAPSPQAVTPVPESLVAEANSDIRPTPQSPPATTPPVPASAAQTDPSAAPPPTAAPAPPPQAADVQLPKGQVYGARNTDGRIVLRVHKQGLVTVQGKDRKVYMNRVLNPGDTYRAPNLVGLSVSAIDGQAVEIILDGASMGYAGTSGSSASGLSLDPQAVVDRSQRNRPG